jgi:hypothetical protein
MSEKVKIKIARNVVHLPAIALRGLIHRQIVNNASLPNPTPSQKSLRRIKISR